MSKTKKIIFALLAAAFILLPALSLAQGTGAPTSTNPQTGVNQTTNNQPTIEATPTANAVGIKDWSTGTVAVEQPTGDICEAIFTADTQNIFKDVICNLVRVIAVSTSQFATQMTCTIQRVGVDSNYFDTINFVFGNQRCTASGGESGQLSPIPGTSSGQTDDGMVFGSRPNSNAVAGGGTANPTGFYSDDPAHNKSALTNQLQSDRPAQIAFSITRWLVALAGIIALIIFAFANILHLELNTYAIKKAIPSILIAIIGGWLSITIVILLVRFVDFTYRLNIFSPYQALYPMNNIFGGSFASDFANGAANPQTGVSLSAQNSVSLIYDVGNKILGQTSTSFFSGLLGTVFLLIPALEVFIFEYVLALRPFIVVILAAIGPLAFACLVLPQTQFIFRKWWTYLLIAIFFTPIVNFVFYLVNLFPTDPTSGSVAFMALWFVKIVIIGFLIRLPFAFESDAKKITAKLADTKFGAAIGLKKFGAGVGGEKPAPESNAKSDLAPDKSKQIQNLARTKTYPLNVTPGVTSGGRGARMPTPEVKIANLSKILQEASKTNLNRPANLIARSVKDLSADTMKAVVDKSDLQLWRDTRLIEQLKNQNGQVLDEQGAAIRSDATRKLLRLAQEFTGGKLNNPETIKALAQKGLLGSLPEPIVKEAVREGVLNRNDLLPSFAARTQAIYDAAQSNDQLKNKGVFLSPQASKLLMQKDQLDYESGFTDIKNNLAQALTNPKLPTAAAAKGIVENFKGDQPKMWVQHGQYYLQRLVEGKNSATANIADTLKQNGVAAASAIALSKNANLTAELAARYLPEGKKSPQVLQKLQAGFRERDLNSSSTNEIARTMFAEKTMVAKSITAKISAAIKSSDNLDFPQIAKSMQDATKKLAEPASPEQIGDLAKQINEYHPSATLKTGGDYSQDDISKITDRAKEVLETVGNLVTGGVDKKSLLGNPEKAATVAQNQIGQQISQTVAGGVAKDSEFENQLNAIIEQGKNGPAK